MESLKTGIAGFDELLGGGLPQGSVVLLHGVPGFGSTTFAYHISYNRVSDKKPLTYFLVKRLASDVEDELAVFKWKINRFKRSGLWRFVEDVKSANKLKSLVEESMAEGRWTVIDSLSDLLLSEDALNVVELLSSMSSCARRFGGLHLALLTEGMHNPRVETAMQHFADGVITFGFESGREEGVTRRLRVRKMRRKIVSPVPIPFSVGEHGIVIKTAIRIA